MKVTLAGDDIDADDDVSSLGYTILSSPSEGSVSNNGDGTFVFDPGTDFQDLAAGEIRTVSFDYKGTDSHSADSNVATATISVTGTNDGPVAVADSNGTSENASVTTNVIANDTDVDATDVLSLVSGSASIASMTEDATSSAIAVSTASVSQSGNEITFDPGSDFDFLATGETATVVIDYTVTDDDASPLTAAGTLTITVTGTNDGPFIENVSKDWQDVQYSDLIDSVTFEFSDVDSETLTATISLPDAGTLEPRLASNSAGVSTPNSSGFGSTGTWVLSGIADLHRHLCHRSNGDGR